MCRELGVSGRTFAIGTPIRRNKIKPSQTVRPRSNPHSCSLPERLEKAEIFPFAQPEIKKRKNQTDSPKPGFLPVAKDGAKIKRTTQI
jgi:hypothetical protein